MKSYHILIGQISLHLLINKHEDDSKTLLTAKLTKYSQRTQGLNFLITIVCVHCEILLRALRLKIILF
jgi:hypothetical protein